MADTQTGEILKVTDPDDAADLIAAEDGVDPGAQIPEIEEEYAPEPPIPFEASSADIAEQHAEVPADPAEDYR